MREYVDVMTAHEYGIHATAPLQTEKPVWMTEWSSSLSTFNTQWDCGECIGGPDGMYLAQDVVQAFARGHVSAYLYWWGTSEKAAGLIQTTKDGYTVAKRYYAIAGVSRFVRAGAERVEVATGSAEVEGVGFRNPDGSRVLALVNRGRRNLDLELGMDEGTAGMAMKGYVTDVSHSVMETEVGAMKGRTLGVTVRRRSLTTVVWEAKKSS